MVAMLLNSEANCPPSVSCDVLGSNAALPAADSPCRWCNVDISSGFDTLPAGEVMPVKVDANVELAKPGGSIG